MGDPKQYPLRAEDYKLLDESGSGVSSIVWRALCIPYNEVVAVKVMDLERCMGSLDGVRKECLIMSTINHPNVVRAYASFVHKSELWLVMPYLAAGSVLSIMRYGHPTGLKETVIQVILRETLKGLEYLHKNGHIHRDIKAGNILIDKDGTTKLADFGVTAALAEGADRLETRQTFVGTPHWMAPEVMEQSKGYDWRADIWSFGITCLELAHGHAPFAKYPPMKVLLMTLQGAPPTLDSEGHKGKFSKDFREVVAKCLQKEPSQRPSASKLLQMNFFKSSHDEKFLVKHLIEGLPPLGERIRVAKEAAAQLRQLGGGAQVPEQQQQKSNQEYQKAVSGWNFDVKALKAQAALLGDSDDENMDQKPDFVPATILEGNEEEFQTVTNDIPFSGAAALAGVAAAAAAAEGLQAAPPSSMSASAPSVPVKVPQHRGRFDIYDGPLLSPESTDDKTAEALRAMAATAAQRSASAAAMAVVGGQVEATAESAAMAPKGPGLPPPVPPGSVAAAAASAAGAAPPPGPSSSMRKGRFSVTEDDDHDAATSPSPTAAGASGVRPSMGSPPVQPAPAPTLQPPPASVGGPQPAAAAPTGMPGALMATPSSTNTLPPESFVPQLQSLIAQAANQQNVINSLINALAQQGAVDGENMHMLRPLPPLFDGLALRQRNGLLDANSEMELLTRIKELQQQVASLMEENQSTKKRNVELERQLNALMNDKLAKEDADRGLS